MKSISVRIISCILALVMSLAVLVACKDDDTNQLETNPATNQGTLPSLDIDTNQNTDTSSDTEFTESDTTDLGTESGTEPGSELESDFDTDILPDVDTEAFTVFANGEYLAEVIRGDIANQLDKNVYTEIRDLMKRRVSKTPGIETDFVAVGQEKYNGPAILIGETNYEESIQVYKTLSSGQGVAKLVGNKFVIAYTNEASATKLIEAFKTALNKKATKTEITIDATWNSYVKSTVTYTGNTSFDEDGLIKELKITLDVFGTEYDSGQWGRTYIKKAVTSKKAFDEFCINLEKGGCKRYTANTIGNNLFATYLTQTQIIHLMYFPSKAEIRTAVDPRGTGFSPTTGQPLFTVPKLKSENKYTKKTDDTKMIVCDIDNASWPGGMCIIYQLADGRFFIVDAGIGGATYDKRTTVGSSSEWIYKTLAKYADDSKNIQVAAWLITHPHSDHAGGLYDIAVGWHAKYGKSKTDISYIKQRIKIDTIIYNQPAAMVHGRADWMETIIKTFAPNNVVKAHPGQVFYIADLTLTIYGSQDIMIEDTKNMIEKHETGNRCDLNEQSVSARAEFNGKSALLLGDSDFFPNRQLAAIYKDSLKSDILQLSHHGYGDTGDTDVNSYCDPSIAIWAVSDGDRRSNWKINQNSSINSLSVKNYKPYKWKNLIFDKNWNVSHAGV